MCLIYYEVFNHIESAVAREKLLKKRKREWKERIIKEMNPEMRRLNDDVFRFKKGDSYLRRNDRPGVGHVPIVIGIGLNARESTSIS